MTKRDRSLEAAVKEINYQALSITAQASVDLYLQNRVTWDDVTHGARTFLDDFLFREVERFATDDQARIRPGRRG